MIIFVILDVWHIGMSTMHCIVYMYVYSGDGTLCAGVRRESSPGGEIQRNQKSEKRV